MNDRMWANPANQENLSTLKRRGVHVIDPGTGFLACGTVAEGRLAEPDVIVQQVLERLAPGPLSGAHVLVTAGPTHEPIDAVRFLGNRSSGRMGLALAESARDLGARVTLLLGPSELPPPGGVDVRRFTTAAELLALATSEAPGADAVAMAAAVADFRPTRAASGKLKKDAGIPSLQLEATDDVLAALSARRPVGQFLIGFALETGDDAQVEAQAKAKLATKRLDLVCGNRADVAGEGFEGDRNRVYLAARDGAAAWVGPASKREVADAIWKRALECAWAARAAS
jgi:phosphopantothenoylcysteine decarboxylase/phosphopantothenate--cysteine ligase